MAKAKQEVNDAYESFNKLYAKGGIVNLGTHPRYPTKKLSGRPSLDYVTDGGFPTGRLILIAGEPSAGKSSLTIQIAPIFGKRVLYVDTEATLTTDYILSLGVDPNTFSHMIPSTTEEMCNSVREQIPNFDVIIIDSINNSASGEQMQKTAEERTMSNRARVLSEQLPIIIGLSNQHNTTVIVLSQVRDNMNKQNKYSPDTIVPGGNSLHHNSSLTLELFKSSKKKEKEDGTLNSKVDAVVGNMIRIKCTKNKVGKVNREVTVEFTYGEGYTIEADVASSAVRLGIVEKAGSWLKYDGATIAQGVDNLTPVLKDNPELLKELLDKIQTMAKEQEDEH